VETALLPEEDILEADQPIVAMLQGGAGRL
jgi:hypothetical protein